MTIIIEEEVHEDLNVGADDETILTGEEVREDLDVVAKDEQRPINTAEK